MKTTIELPDQLFWKAKAKAAEHGKTLKDFFTEALVEKLSTPHRAETSEPAWMKGFGKLRTLRKETARIQKDIQEEFEQIEPEDRL